MNSQFDVNTLVLNPSANIQFDDSSLLSPILGLTAYENSSAELLGGLNTIGHVLLYSNASVVVSKECNVNQLQINGDSNVVVSLIPISGAISLLQGTGTLSIGTLSSITIGIESSLNTIFNGKIRLDFAATIRFDGLTFSGSVQSYGDAIVIADGLIIASENLLINGTMNVARYLFVQKGSNVEIYGGSCVSNKGSSTVLGVISCNQGQYLHEQVSTTIIGDAGLIIAPTIFIKEGSFILEGDATLRGDVIFAGSVQMNNNSLHVVGSLIFYGTNKLNVQFSSASNTPIFVAGMVTLGGELSYSLGLANFTYDTPISFPLLTSTYPISGNFASTTGLDSEGFLISIENSTVWITFTPHHPQPPNPNDDNRWKLIVGVTVGVGGSLIILGVGFIIWKKKSNKSAEATPILSRRQ